MVRPVCPWRAASVALVTVSSVALSGCGFTPLYATPGMSSELSGVQVEAPPHSRLGFLMKERLNDQLARAEGSRPLYVLKFEVADKRYPRGVAVNNVASRYEIDLTAKYTLTDATTGKEVLTDTVLAQVGYDSSSPPYSGLAAEQDGEARVAEQAAIAVRLALSRYFLAHRPGM